MNNAYEVNRRSVLAARVLGHGLNGLKAFCSVMDLPQPISHSNYDIINKDLQTISKEVAKESMKTAIEEVCIKKYIFMYTCNIFIKDLLLKYIRKIFYTILHVFHI